MSAVRKAFAVFHVTDTCTVVVTAATSASRARWLIHQRAEDVDLMFSFTGWRAFRVPELDEWATMAADGVPAPWDSVARAVERRTGVRCR
jgi:hypothetical protein